MTGKNEWVRKIVTDGFNGANLRLILESDSEGNRPEPFFKKLRQSGNHYAHDEKHIDYLRKIIHSHKFSLLRIKNSSYKYIIWKEFGPFAWYDFEVNVEYFENTIIYKV